MMYVPDEIRKAIINDLRAAFIKPSIYKVIEVPDFEETMLNEFSENGWDLISVVNKAEKYKLVFRRIT